MLVKDLLLRLEGVDPEKPVFVFNTLKNEGYVADGATSGVASQDGTYYTADENMIEPATELEIPSFVIFGE